MNDDKRGPLADQLAQARRDAADRAAQAVDQASDVASDATADAPASPHKGAPRSAKENRQVLREVRSGTEILTNMRHDPPPAPTGCLGPTRRTSWRVWRPGFGRVL